MKAPRDPDELLSSFYTLVDYVRTHKPDLSFGHLRLGERLFEAATPGHLDGADLILQQLHHRYGNTLELTTLLRAENDELVELTVDAGPLSVYVPESERKQFLLDLAEIISTIGPMDFFLRVHGHHLKLSTSMSGEPFFEVRKLTGPDA